MANIYDTEIFVYKGAYCCPDGTSVPLEAVTAFFDDEDWCGEYFFAVDGEELYPTGTAGNANSVFPCSRYSCYKEYLKVCGDSCG